MRLSLNGEWRLTFTHPGDGRRVALPISVPGNVEQALEAGGIIRDCMPADSDSATSLYNQVDDWTFERTFDWPGGDTAAPCELVFDGIDTIADIYLNGEFVAHTDDMFVPQRVDVSGRLKKEGNHLTVVIRSAVMWAARQPQDVFSWARHENCYASQPRLRKARHEWGWDNAPRLLTSGLYRAVYIDAPETNRFDNVYLYTGHVSADAVSLGVLWSAVTERHDMTGCRLNCQLWSGGRLVYTSDTAVVFPRGALRFTLPRDQVALWWPAGYGEPSLSHIRLELRDSGGILAAWESDWGIRTIRLERSEDVSAGNEGEFVFLVNNERIFIRGTNWKPLDALHSRADGRVERALEMAKDLNCNMIRVWGGGIYEDHPFFDYCDRHGIMVWQDFMFGCEFPPCDDEFCQKVADETRVIIEKLRNHASLAVWCGDNEDDLCLGWNHMDSHIRPSDNRVNREVLPRCVLRYDPYRSYVASSPYCSDAFYDSLRAGVNDISTIEAHLYPATARFSEALRATKSRFIGETGPIIVNAMTDNERIFAREEARARRLWDEYLPPEKRHLTMHQWDSYFVSWRQTGRELCLARYGRDFTIDQWRDYALAINLICADVFKDVIEYSRASRWEKTGVIWWSLMDMWPMLFNYSVIDYDFKPKMPYYWIRQSQQPFCLMAVRMDLDGEPALYACNDTSRRITGLYRVYEMRDDGDIALFAQGRLDEAANGCRLIQRLPEGADTRLWIIRWQADGQRGSNHFTTGDKSASFERYAAWHKRLMSEYGIPSDDADDPYNSGAEGGTQDENIAEW